MAKKLIKTETLIIFLIFVIALIARLYFVFKLPHPPLLTDAFNYDVMTKQFLDKGFLGYLTNKPNAYITPGYPFFLSIIYIIFGYSSSSPLLQVRVIQAILGAISAIVLYLIGKNLVNRKTGFVASVLYAMYLPFLWAPTLILTETTYNFFFLIYIYLTTKVFKAKATVFFIFYGLIFAVAVLIRPVIFPLFIVPFLYQYIFVEKDKRIFKIFAYSSFGVILLMLPWWIRNLVTMHKFIILATQTGNPLIAGMFPYFKNVDLSHYNVNDQVKEGIKMLIQGFKKEPLLYLKWFTVGKLYYLFRYQWFLPSRLFSFVPLLKLVHYISLGFGSIGFLFSVFNKNMRLISILTAIIIGLQLMFIPESRYVHSIIPFFMIMTGYILNLGYNFVSKKC